MNREQAERQYRTAYAQMVTARDVLDDATKAVYRSRAIDYPFRGPTLLKVHHANARMRQIATEVQTERQRQKRETAS